MVSPVVTVPRRLNERYLSVLTDITHLLLHDASPDEVCEAIFRKLRSVLQLDAYFHFRLTTDGTRLKLASCRGCPPERLSEVEFLEFGQAVCGTVAASQRWMYVPNVPTCENELAEFVRSIGIKCYVCQPLIANDRLLGTFSFGTRERGEYNPQELQLIHLVCDQVAIATARDITREQHLRLERIAFAGQMAAKIAHEINNPLEAITNLLYLLADEDLSQEGESYVALAQEQLKRVSYISRQTLSFYRDNRSPSAVGLRHAAQSALSISNLAATRKKVTVTVDIPRDLKAHAIDVELVEILNNLLANAIHYSPAEETVTLAAIRRAGQVEVFVSDHGTGVDSEFSGKLFQPFATTRKEGGNGLGLWISRELARKVGGDLSLIPSTEGATFKLVLRAA